MDKATEASELESIKENLARKAQRLGEIIYAQAQQQQGAGGGFDPNAGGFGPEGPSPEESGPQAEPKSDGPIDADFEVVDDK